MKIIVLVVCGIAMTPVIAYPLANKIKGLRKFYCKIGRHCHSKDYQFEEFDGASEHCKCKWCGYKGMIDSQGNLF